MSARRGQIAFASSLLCAVCAAGGAVTAFLVAPRAAMAVLAISACAAFVALVLGFVSLRGDRFAHSLGAIVASLVVLVTVGLAFGAVSVRSFVAAVQEGQRPQPIEDEAFRFRLTPPTDDTEMFDRERIGALHPRAVAGYRIQGVHEADHADLVVAVFVEPTYGLPLADAAALQLPEIAEVNVSWRSALEPTRLDGREALRARQQVTDDDGIRWRELTFLVDRGHLYVLLAQRYGDAPTGEPWFPRAHSSFTLLGGEIADDESYPSVDARGAGWSLEQGTFHSRAWGVSFEGDERWELLPGSTASATWDGAFLVVRRRRPEVIARLAALPTTGRTEAEVRADPHWAAPAATEAPPLTLDLAGGRVTFAAVHEEAAWPHQGRAGWLPMEGRAISLQVFAPTLEAADAALRELTPRVSSGPRDPSFESWTHVGPEHWVRGDTLWFEGERVSWTRPSSAWRARVTGFEWLGPAGVSVRELARLEAPALGIVGHLRWRAGQSDAVAGEPFGAGRIMRTPDPPSGLVHVSAWWSDGEGEWEIDLRGSASDVATHDAAIRAALQGLRIDTAPPASGFGEDGAYRDPRLGFTFTSSRPLDGPFDIDGHEAGIWLSLDQEGGTAALLASPRDGGSAAEQARSLVVAAFPMARLGPPSPEPARLGDCAPATAARQETPMGLGGSLLVHCEAHGVLYVLYAYRGPGGAEVESLGDGLRLQ
ncbi:MAG: hypothetical protein VYE22_12945 [Myxococcota bacterium]|nr:hypothetical protein [Myxococcota bacterium]